MRMAAMVPTREEGPRDWDEAMSLRVFCPDALRDKLLV